MIKKHLLLLSLVFAIILSTNAQSSNNMPQGNNEDLAVFQNKQENKDIKLSHGVEQGDYDALVAIYNSMGGASWTNQSNWNSDENVENWSGVYVNTQYQ